MCKRTMFTTISVFLLLILSSTIVSAQPAAGKTGWAARALAALNAEGRGTKGEEAVSTDRAQLEQGFQPIAEVGANDSLERFKENRRKALTGTWRIAVAPSVAGFPAFNAYHGFHEGGTFTECSDLLPNLTETPAFGAWDLDGYRYALTFELFVFDEMKKPAGRVRVRCSLEIVNDELRGDTIVDFIEPDGTVILDIDRGPFTGRKLRAQVLQ